MATRRAPSWRKRGAGYGCPRPCAASTGRGADAVTSATARVPARAKRVGGALGGTHLLRREPRDHIRGHTTRGAGPDGPTASPAQPSPASRWAAMAHLRRFVEEERSLERARRGTAT